MTTNNPTIPRPRTSGTDQPSEAPDADPNDLRGIKADAYQVLEDAGDELLLREVTDRTEWSYSSVGTALSDLYAAGLLERRPDVTSPKRNYYQIPDSDSGSTSTSISSTTRNGN